MADDNRVALMDTPPGDLIWVWNETGVTPHLAPFGLSPCAWGAPADFMTTCGQNFVRASHNPWANCGLYTKDFCGACIVSLLSSPYGHRWFGLPSVTCDYPAGYHVSPHVGCPLR